MQIEEGTVPGHDDVELWWKTFTPASPRATVVLAHGAADHSARHADTIARLGELGFAVHTFDFRGHGRSSGRRGHVERFDEYVADLRLFVERAVARTTGKVFVLAHSQGGLVATHFALAKPQGISGFAFSAPYFALAEQPPRIKMLLANTVGRLLPRLGVPHGMGPERLTRDPERQAATRADPLFVQVVTPRWFRESGPARALAIARAGELTQPCVFFVPLGDRVVDAEATKRVFEAIGSTDKTLRVFPDARHELMNELAETRAAFLHELGTWLEARA